LSSPVVDGWWRIGTGYCRRAAAADRWWRDRGCSNSSEDGDGTGHCVAREASLGSRGCAEVVGWLGRRAGSRARRRVSGGGRGEIPPASWQLEQTNKRAQELQGGPTKWKTARVGEGEQAGVEFTVRHPWRMAAARRPREEGLAGFIVVHKAVEAMAWAPS
jgi:hypothetical protein